MANIKFIETSTLAEYTITQVSKSRKEWISFLDTASRQYKYHFEEQILIYAQRPKATACASIDVWNSKMKCWVKKGSKGIALLDNTTFSKLRYVFDIQDVYPIKGQGGYPKLWEMKKDYHSMIIKHLMEEYSLEKAINLKELIGILSDVLAEEQLENICRYIYGEAREIPKAELKETFSDSIRYMLFRRCGFEEETLNSIPFSYIHKISEWESMMVFGEQLSNTVRPVLMGIGKVILNYEKNLEKTLAKKEDIVYYSLNQTELETKTSNTMEKGEIDDGIRVYTGGRLPNPESESESATGRSNHEVRIDEEAFSRGEPKTDILQLSSERDVETTSFRYSGTGGNENGNSDRTDETIRGNYGTAKGGRPNALDTEDEQYYTDSGRNREERDNLHLVESEEEKSDNEELSDFSLEEISKRTDNNYEQLHLFHGVETNLEFSDSEKEVSKNFRILSEDDQIEKGFSPKEKFHHNIEAIHTLKKIEKEVRSATWEEQQILSKYVGWGGLSDAFDENKKNWSSEYQQLKELLSPQEYTLARESTLNAHYTSSVIIKGMYEALSKFGFTKGTILEPSAGIGRFFGMLPEHMQESQLYGVELDSISGRIAKMLYPKADIQIKGFEETSFPNEFFDVAIGNVPFGSYKVMDRDYDKLNFLIHDYFFAKTLDKVRKGGVIAFITSKGTMDKKSSFVRKYLAQRAELLGAIRLPNTAFKGNAGTDVTSDILFLKKREDLADDNAEWITLGTDENGITMNQYFISHPEMIVGKMEMVSGPFGMESVCIPDTTSKLETQLQRAISFLDGQMGQEEQKELEVLSENKSILEGTDIRNYSYTIADENVYYYENTMMELCDFNEKDTERIKALIPLRDCTRDLIQYQIEGYSEKEITEKQAELNSKYDAFCQKFGRINEKANRKVFCRDSSYSLLASLEVLDEEGNFLRKADMFTKRTIKNRDIVTSVDTSNEALAVSLAEKAKIDFSYMSELSGKSEEEIKTELRGVIFLNPITEQWETADEYLSGNVRERLETAKLFATTDHFFEINVEALEKVQPKELNASEIEVRLGATWIDTVFIEDFMKEVLQTPDYLFRRNFIAVQYSDITGEWRIKGKNADNGNSLVNMTYGTKRANAYKILEDSLNLRDTRIFDVLHEDGKEKRVLNKQETMLASQKQESIREEFKDWIFKTPKRREVLCKKYNRIFNSIRQREYNGSHLIFPGMTTEVTLKPHQLNAVARQLYGSNTLLAHCVGAGKTFEMIAAAMESKRLGLCQKSLFVVPNHLTEQWANDFLRLYPGANILAATKKDFEPANRKRFCARIATGEYDAVIIGHSQFERIPLSQERQASNIEKQILEIETTIKQLKESHGEHYTIKQMEKTRKTLQVRLSRLNDTKRKDNVITFEELGVDRLFVDESHYYKNLFLYTKMRNVAGIAQAEAQKSSDMFAKCRYIDEITGGKGITFATGTPISNSMTELYTNMRYLQYDTLQKIGLGNFDAWASTFGETQTAIELAPEGTGYRAKTRFAKFYNLPELISLFKEIADIQTADMLNLPVPEAEYRNIVQKPSQHQKEMVESLAKRAEAVRNGMVEPHQDNMLKITNDGRKLALDQRLMNELLPDNENSKVKACVNQAFQIWEETKEKKLTQLIFCDLSTPKGDGTFNVYDDIQHKLVQKGVPKEEIAFIHEANTEKRKTELFAKVRSGQVRFLLGSTVKMGAGTNVQNRLIALHHLDVPWRPSDIQQQEGRILRQGNVNPKVSIFRYITESTFDSYSWQIIENKQKFIGQIMTGKSPVRACDDVDETALSYAEVKALATGNPYIKEKMQLDIEVAKLKLLKANYTSQIYRLEDDIARKYPQKIAKISEIVEGYKADIDTYTKNKIVDKDTFQIKIGNQVYTEKRVAAEILLKICHSIKETDKVVFIGEYQGFSLGIKYNTMWNEFEAVMKGKLSHSVQLGLDAFGNLTRMNNILESIPKNLENQEQELHNVRTQFENAKEEVVKPFIKEDVLKEKTKRLAELNALLNMDKKELFADGMEDDMVEEEETMEMNKPEAVVKHSVGKSITAPRL